eukprot:TRINITY_DN19263_c0_g1::TRINITY_DN19263_c0_g1_i1::g.15818::m.15818 TRINITY_DN19263_c0_g1::TRINITY_DN19263_c0_g1_i1::g.15818  ORF type:complete len:290 (+),score=23.84,SHIPPO-rpt/PF07004.7/0.24,SHIPPO-rpt/PF07004.7/7.5,SHIPPO-rpt/PF07004.7/0.049,SHIPPO-rpt/PF07004.7/0.3,SHIPPO-rpt/PF07004.7/0.014,SHIPPO-rpt/PF07004.7/4.6e+02,ECR1_N/PF14382.1/2.8e+02,ECR1_N/PF14382.1/33,ECR1_N/PF14382.1/3.4e+03,ECR1_N/PF14382.1/45 TRINITY_DN19263_c0_g1_i1:91-960(+)
MGTNTSPNHRSAYSLPLSARSSRVSYNLSTANGGTFRVMTARQARKEQPGPGYYTPKDTFTDDIIRDASPKYTIRGPSREQVDYLKLITKESVSPGPTYFPNTSTSLTSRLGDSPRYSFGSSARSRADRGNLAPGPGAYTPQFPQLPSGAPEIHFGKSTRPDIGLKSAFPGPGTYEPIRTKHGAGGDLGDAPGYTMGARPNEALERPITVPGPGTYNSNPNSVKLVPPAFRFGRSEQRYHPQTSRKRLLISKDHQHENIGLDSPGPIYRFAPPPGGPRFSFGTAERFPD